MIVSKAMRNIRQKIDWTWDNSANTMSCLWGFTYAYEGLGERVDIGSTFAWDATVIALTGGTFTDDDWYNLFNTYGNSVTVTQWSNYRAANRSDISASIFARTQACARLTQEATGRFLNLDFTYGNNQLNATPFTSILFMITNNNISTLNDSVACYNFFEISYQDLLDMGIPLVNLGNGTYRINIAVDRLRMKISEDV